MFAEYGMTTNLNASNATIRVGPLVAKADAPNIGFLNRQERDSSVLFSFQTRARKLL